MRSVHSLPWKEDAAKIGIVCMLATIWKCNNMPNKNTLTLGHHICGSVVLRNDRCWVLFMKKCLNWWCLGTVSLSMGHRVMINLKSFLGNDGNWWSSCIVSHVLDSFRSSRDWQQLRNDDTCRVSLRSTYDAHMGDGSVASTNMLEYHFDGIDEEFGGADGGAASRRS